MKVKEQLHNLIDQIEDNFELESYFSLLSHLSKNEEGILLSQLNNSQKDSLEKSYVESLDSSNLISNEEVKAKYAKWL